MLDGIQPYLDEGEKIYVGKLDSLKAFTGKNRIKIEGKNDVRCKSGKMCYQLQRSYYIGRKV
ncbi:DUF4998 domain-containing protein [Bacteroides thetaiotaomicron]|nr:DUF4998 domain-containing protein [Bacteroides thetaiotaomicron]